MSRLDYVMSLEISANNYPFWALVMAAIRQSDSHNFEKFEQMFPDVMAEFQERYHTPGGHLPGEEDPN